MRILLHGLTFTGTLTDGTAVEYDMTGRTVPTTVWARPAAGDTITVSYSCDSGVTYTAWSPGAVVAYTESVFTAPITHLKFQRTAGAGTTSAYGVC